MKKRVVMEIFITPLYDEADRRMFIKNVVQGSFDIYKLSNLSISQFVSRNRVVKTNKNNPKGTKTGLDMLADVSAIVQIQSLKSRQFDLGSC